MLERARARDPSVRGCLNFLARVVCRVFESCSFSDKYTKGGRAYVYTVKSCTKATACVQYFNFLERLLFKCGFYLRAVMCNVLRNP